MEPERPRRLEADCRRPGFAPGVGITLADGQTWQFPRPVIELVPELGPRGEVTDLVGRPSLGDDYEAKLEAFLQAEAGQAQLLALMGLAVDLLGRNYRLEPNDIRRLLRYRAGDAANLAMWQAIADVAQGNPGPKPSPVGDEPT